MYLLKRLLKKPISQYCGRHNLSAELKVTKYELITPEIFKVPCNECGGDGDWGKFLFEGHNAEEYAKAFNIKLPYIRGTYICIDCKGTGSVYL